MSTARENIESAAAGAFDLRVWLERARSIGQLKEVGAANLALELELGCITDLNAKRSGPALLFDDFTGYPHGFRVLTGAMMNAATFGLAMGFEGGLSDLEVVDRVASALQSAESRAKEFPVEYVESGPVMENSVTDNDVDLTIFPTPTWHELDGGPYIGTACSQVQRDPDSPWTNVGTYRNQLLGKNVVGNYIAPMHHGSIIRQKYWDRGEPCPIVVGFGGHPLIALISGGEVPAGEDELSWIGAIAGQRVPVIKGPVTGLPIPADWEIAIEGYVAEGDTMIEGPLGEFTGYYAGGRNAEPVIRVKALYHRDDPILLGAPPARPPHSYSYQLSVIRSALVKEALRKAGVPAVKAVWESVPGFALAWVVTSIAQQYAGHASQAAAVAFNCAAGGSDGRYSIVVDDDIDPTNMEDVVWALSSRSDPATDIDILRHTWTNTLDPMLTDEDKAAHRWWTSRAIINACRPYDRLHTFSAVAEASPELTEATIKKWEHLFD